MQDNTTTYTLPPAVQEFIERYKNLDIAGKKVNTPYYRNKKRVRGGLRSLGGKGTPEEIELEVKIMSQLRGVDLASMSVDEIREFMMKEGIGIDCSGFVAQVLDFWLRKAGAGSLLRNLKYPYRNLLSRIKVPLRPIANISADILTNEQNTTRIEINDVRPGDLIRTKGLKQGDHILLVHRVVANSAVTEIHYVNSNENYGDKNGVREGVIKITDPTKPLSQQEWVDFDEDNKCWTLQGLQREEEDNGLRRPRFFNKLQQL